jgi:ribonucleoside-diphosphate reductase beta chain
MASFAITFGIAETGIFQGISQDVVLICRDEMLHGRAGAVILGIEKQNNPEFFQKDKMQALFDAVLQTELEWTDHLFSEGRQCPGINANRIKRYVKYMAQPVAKTLGLDCEVIEENPLPYMDAYIDSSKTQIAAQELQLTSYLVNAVKAPIALEATLTELREEFS